MHYSTKSIAQVLDELHTSEQNGLTEREASTRLQAQGRNVLPEHGLHSSPGMIFLRQWKSPLILVLLVAGAASGFLGEVVDMAIIFATAVINTVIGFFQEYKADHALKKLASFIPQRAVVLRNGVQVQIDASELVCGDIVFVQPGQHVSADGRLLTAKKLLVQEAALTGESEPVRKHTEPLAREVVVGDQHNMVFRGTTVLSGEGIFVVTATGVHTQIGRIAALVHTTSDDQTPLQEQLAKLAKHITLVIVLIAAGIFFIGTAVRGTGHMLELFATAVAVAVAAIPEGLVISLTVILATGMQFILKRNALVRRLVAAETLGSVSVICTDKTGTLTEGNMSLKEIFTSGETIPLKHIEANKQALRALEIGIVSNEATATISDRGERIFLGDTTDIALLKSAEAVGFDRRALLAVAPIIASIPFSSERKYMATLHRTQQGEEIRVKGAPEILLARATSMLQDGRVTAIDAQAKRTYGAALEKYTAQGYRTLAFAYREVPGQQTLADADVQSLVFAGIAVIADPIRAGVKETIQTAEQAGIRVIMITGDHRNTARAIGEELGLRITDDSVCDGSELESMTNDALAVRVQRTTIFARVNPEHKIRIVQALQANGEVVAMTGDGINDAPALKGADIGVAVGSGTDVAKETADMVLLDDSFNTIVAAVQEGRGLYENIKKVVAYMLSGSFAEVVMIVGSLVAGLPVAALPAQILWVNAIEDAFPTMALAFEKTDPRVMREPPRKRTGKLFTPEMKWIIVLKSTVANVVLFAMFYYTLKSTGNIELTRTVVFTGFAIDALFDVFALRKLHAQFWQYSPFSNLYVVGAVLFGWAMLLLAIYFPPLQYVLHTVPLSLGQWGMLIGFGVFNAILVELVKLKYSYAS